jgi:hypothetical protein
MTMIFSRLARFARSPQGRALFGQAKRYAQSPQGRAKIDQARQQIASRRKPKSTGTKPDGR